jgi:hypothetical protein
LLYLIASSALANCAEAGAERLTAAIARAIEAIFFKVEPFGEQMEIRNAE